MLDCTLMSADISDPREPDYARIERLRSLLTESITDANPDLLSSYPVQRCVEELDAAAAAEHHRYRDIPARLRDQGRTLEQSVAPTTVGNYHKLILLAFMATFKARVAAQSIPPSVLTRFAAQFDRIMDEMGFQECQHYQSSCDGYLKDLGLCRTVLYPCGAEVLDTNSGVPRRTLFSNGPRQLARSLSFFASRRQGFKPYYELHMHRPLKPEFTPEGWTETYFRIAELLALNPHINGVICTSWWYDPQLEQISPRLAYLRSQPLDGHAAMFYVSADVEGTSGAIEVSETRRALYKSGEYIPKLYLMVWARDDLMRWAGNRR